MYQSFISQTFLLIISFTTKSTYFPSSGFSMILNVLIQFTMAVHFFYSIYAAVKTYSRVSSPRIVNNCYVQYLSLWQARKTGMILQGCSHSGMEIDIRLEQSVSYFNGYFSSSTQNGTTNAQLSYSWKYFPSKFCTKTGIFGSSAYTS